MISHRSPLLLLIISKNMMKNTVKTNIQGLVEIKMSCNRTMTVKRKKIKEKSQIIDK